MTKPIVEIDGGRIDSLEGFFEEFGRSALTAPWGRNLDAFNDVLRGGFGTPDGGFVLRWLNSEDSKRSLSYAATVSYLRKKLGRCHPDNVSVVEQDLEAARRGEGPTVFEILIEIIRCHGPGGDEAEDGVDLELR